MSTKIRNSISKKNPNYISKYRYLELKNFCLQYPEWKERLREINYYRLAEDGDPKRPTEDLAIEELYLKRKIELVERTAEEVDPTISSFLLQCVTCGKSYNVLVAYGIPCGKEYFYKRYREFFRRLGIL